MWRWASAPTGATAAASYLAAFSGKLTGTSLYLRPFVICTDTQLGVHGITNAAFYIIASPVGSYYPNGLAPVRIAIERDDVRGGGIGPVSQALYDAITGIQYGRIADTHGWVTRLAPAQAFPCGA